MPIGCEETGAHPYVQVFWRSSTGAFSEEASLKFKASLGSNLIPFNYSPYWSLLPEIAEIRIDVAERADCTSVSMEELALYERTSLTDH